MKTKIIKGKVEVLLVDELPIGVAYGIHNKESTRSAILVEGLDFVITPFPLPENLPLNTNWQFLSTIEDLTEENAVNLVDSLPNPMSFMYRDFKDYTSLSKGSISYILTSAMKSFQSLLIANKVLSKNPFGKKPYFPEQGSYAAKMMDAPTFRALKSQFEQWHEAEAKVFNPKTTLIFIKQ